MKKSLLSLNGLALGLLLITGCGGSSNDPVLARVSGKVTFEGVPVEEGFIIFKDPDGGVKSYASPLRNGMFDTKIEPGNKVVEITAERDVPGKKMKGASGEDIPARELFIPKKYNSQSELTVQIPPSGKSGIEFSLSEK